MKLLCKLTKQIGAEMIRLSNDHIRLMNEYEAYWNNPHSLDRDTLNKMAYEIQKIHQDIYPAIYFIKENYAEVLKHIDNHQQFIEVLKKTGAEKIKIYNHHNEEEENVTNRETD